MNDKRILELINAGIDGELNEVEQAELQQILDQSPQARALNLELQSLATVIAELPQREPPENLRNNILKNVILPGKPKKTFTLFRLPAVAGYGLAAAAGLAMIIGVYQFGPRDSSPEEISRMTGTIVELPAVEAGLVLDSFTIEQEMISGKVSLLGSGDDFILDFNFDSSADLDVVIEFVENDLEFGGFSKNGNDPGEVNMAGGAIRINTLADDRFTLNLHRIDGFAKSKSVRITTKIYKAGARIHEGELISK
jgi:hypothetical protein